MTTTDYDHALDVAVSRIDLDRPTGGPVWSIIDAMKDYESYGDTDIAPRVAAVGGTNGAFFLRMAVNMKCGNLCGPDRELLISLLEVEARTRDVLCARRVNEMANEMAKGAAR